MEQSHHIPDAGSKVARSDVPVPMPTEMAALDARTKAVRRWRKLVADLVSDSGGQGECSTARMALIGRLASACVLAERLEARVVDGEKVDVQEFVQLAGVINRLAARLGLSRKARKVETLQDVITDIAREREAEDE